ncbi:MAG: PD40 domain-containing protein, partial [Bacteroidales bacterium]|nr:PD40 domain-containing protein [Bacteroidales bacterium]
MKTPATNKLLFILLVLFFAGTFQVFGQSGFRNESELKTQANELFVAADYSQAFPLYSQLLSLDPKNPDLNYRFGVCLLYADKSNKEEAIKYLEKAINQVSDVDFYYHLGFAYQSNYFFTDALYNYRKYLQLARNKAKKEFEVERKISMCQNGLEMLKSANDLYVMQKSEVEQKAFYRSYDLSEFGGRFLNLPEEFLSKADLKNKENNVSYFNPQGKLLFYSLENKNQRDLYYRIKQSNGDWSEAYLLSATINTPFDEDYPFLMPDGKTLYFSSKGHNTIGGYDLFRTVYDSATKQWNTAVNLSFPFNTPSDDILFISDANETMAWFASNRNSTNNQITVYKVGIIKKDPNATDLTAIYGKEKLSGDDLGKIKNMAKLDINISDKAFKEIPENQKS